MFHQPRFFWNIRGLIFLPKKLPFGDLPGSSWSIMLYTLRRCNPSRIPVTTRMTFETCSVLRGSRTKPIISQFSRMLGDRNHQHQNWKLFQSSFYGLGFACLMLAKSSKHILPNAGEKIWQKDKHNLKNKSKWFIFSHLKPCFKCTQTSGRFSGNQGSLFTNPNNARLFRGNHWKIPYTCSVWFPPKKRLF